MWRKTNFVWFYYKILLQRSGLVVMMFWPRNHVWFQCNHLIDLCWWRVRVICFCLFVLWVCVWERERERERERKRERESVCLCMCAFWVYIYIRDSFKGFYASPDESNVLVCMLISKLDYLRKLAAVILSPARLTNRRKVIRLNLCLLRLSFYKE